MWGWFTKHLYFCQIDVSCFHLDNHKGPSQSFLRGNIQNLAIGPRSLVCSQQRSPRILHICRGWKLSSYSDLHILHKVTIHILTIGDPHSRDSRWWNNNCYPWKLFRTIRNSMTDWPDIKSSINTVSTNQFVSIPHGSIDRGHLDFCRSYRSVCMWGWFTKHLYFCQIDVSCFHLDNHKGPSQSFLRGNIQNLAIGPRSLVCSQQRSPRILHICRGWKLSSYSDLHILHKVTIHILTIGDPHSRDSRWWNNNCYPWKLFRTIRNSMTDWPDIKSSINTVSTNQFVSIPHGSIDRGHLDFCRSYRSVWCPEYFGPHSRGVEQGQEQ